MRAQVHQPHPLSRARAEQKDHPMAGTEGESQWQNARPALGRLVYLLSCPICKSLMDDPCALNSCNHHFCRKCIEATLCHKQANCPVCHLPAWAKDVKSDRHVDAVVDCVSSLDRLMLSSGRKGPEQKTTKMRMKQRNIRGETQLHITAIKGNLSLMQDLLQQGLNPNVRDNAGWTPLHECCNHGHTDIAALLLDHGALINAPGYDDDTPLHDAVANGHFDIASLLISRGANPRLRNIHGMIAGDFAATEPMKTLLCVPSSYMPSSSNGPFSGGGEFVLLGTALKSQQKFQLDETARKLGAIVVESFSSQVTHLVTSTNQSKCCPRTLKFLCGIAEGKWIVSFQWVVRCQQEKKWVKEAPYEVIGTVVDDQSVVTYAPQKGRKRAMEQVPKLFNWCKFFFAGEYPPPHPSRSNLEELVVIAGGTVLSADPRNGTKNTSFSKVDSKYVIVVTTDMETQNYISPYMFKVSPLWIFDCLSDFKVLL